MDTLRLILIGIGVLVIGSMLIYYWLTSKSPLKISRPESLKAFNLFNKWRTKGSREPINQVRHRTYDDEPDADDIAALSGLTVPLNEPGIDIDNLGPVSAVNNAESAYTESLIIVLNVMAKKGKLFHGLDILNAMREQGMKFGEMNVFHAYAEESSSPVPFCGLANTVEPGTFDIEHMTELETPGLSLFMQLPGPLEGRAAFERMLQLGRSLAESLGGELCDETHSVLTMQTIGHLKEKIEAYHFKQKMATIKKHRH